MSNDGHAGREGSIYVEIGDKARVNRVTVYSRSKRIFCSSHWEKEILWQGVSGVYDNQESVYMTTN